MSISLDDLTLDDLQNGYYIYQFKDGFRFGVDAVLLSNFADIKPREKVIDLGTGTGIIPILLHAKGKGGDFTGIDIQEDAVWISRKSVEYNNLSDRIHIENVDLKEAVNFFGQDTFDVAVSNPPYMVGNDGKHSENMARAISRHEICCNLDDVCKAASRVVKTNGKFFMIHRPGRLAEIFVTLSKYHFEPKRMQLVYPYIDKEPTMVMIESLKCGKPGITIEKPLVMYTK